MRWKAAGTPSACSRLSLARIAARRTHALSPILETLASGCRAAAHEESASRIEELEGGCGSGELVCVISNLDGLAGLRRLGEHPVHRTNASECALYVCRPVLFHTPCPGPRTAGKNIGLSVVSVIVPRASNVSKDLNEGAIAGPFGHSCRVTHVR